MRTKPTTHIVAPGILVALLLGVFMPAAVVAQTPTGTVVTYQGRLTDAGEPVTDAADFEFMLYDAQFDGNFVGMSKTFGTSIVGGLFTVDLDFGTGVFTGDERWLEITVHLTSSPDWVTLTPRQPIRATPYALYALDGAGGGGGSSPWTQSGSIVYYNDGNVGIGTSTPFSRLEVEDAATFAVTGRCVGEGTQGALGGEGAGAEGSGPWFGVIGTSDGATGTGVKGEATATTGVNKGVYGRSYSTTGRGVYGYASAGSGQTVGVMGEAISMDGYGVWGYNDNDEVGSNKAVGVYGSTNNERGVGVKGHAPGPYGVAVWGRNPGTSGHAMLAEATGQSGYTYGLEAYACSPTGYGVYSFNEAESGAGIAIMGETASPDGFGGYFNGKGYFSGNVGIGLTSPTSKLGVAGVIESTSGGFKFPDGTIQTTAGGGGGSLWQQYGSEIYYDAGNVGVGLTDPQTTFHVAGGNWDLVNTEGDFKVGSSTYRLKMGVATGGVGAGHCRIYAGGPSSKLTLGANGEDMLTVTSTDVGIGTTSPSAELDVVGEVRMDSFQMDTDATDGYVLTCDAYGNGTWQAPTGGGGGLTLPYSGSVSSSSSAFSITNTGTSMGSDAISARINNPSSSSDAAAGYFNANDSNGMAIYATSDGNTTIRAAHSGSGRAIQGSSDGDYAGYFSCYGSGGDGVYGHSNTGAGVKAHGLGTGTANPALHVENENYGGIGIFSTCESTDANAVFVNKGSGPIIKGFSGPTGSDLVFQVTNDGTTHTNVLQINGGADLSEQFDVRAGKSEAKPGLVVCIDPDNPGKLVLSHKAYDRTVAGIISGAGGIAPGMMMGQQNSVADGSYPIALTGRVYVWSDATTGAIEPGDLLTTSDTPGHAMKVSDHSRAQGAILGKAMTRLAKGESGLILVLVSLQ